MYQRFSHTARRGAGRSQNFRLVTIAWICNKNLAPFHPTAIERIVMPNPKKIHVLKLFVLGGWASLLLAIPSISRSQTATPEVQPSPAPETSPSSPVSPVESPVQPAPPALPAESSGTAQPAQTPISPLIPPAAGPGALPSPSPKPALAPQTVQALDEQFQQSLRIQRVHPKDLLFISLMDAVRIALYQNPDVRLAVEDAQGAKGALVKATGQFDSKLLAAVGYAKSFTNPADGQAATPDSVRRVINQSLNGVFKTLAANPSAINNISGLIDQSTSIAAKNNIAQSITALFASFDASKQLRNGMTLDFEYGRIFSMRMISQRSLR
jgi:hypothetical protein